MMNVQVLEGGNSSECSSGCESGWTLYLDHSNSNNFSVSCSNKKGKKFHSTRSSSNKHQKVEAFDDDDNNKKDDGFFDDDDEDEDLSMVSDASSGPPHFDHDIDDDEVEELFFSTRKRQQSMRLLSSNSNHHHHFFNKAQDFGLDDTASSPNFISKKNVEGNNGSSLKRMIDYSSQGFSTTHLNQGRSNNFQEHYGFIQPRFSTKQFQPNQWSN